MTEDIAQEHITRCKTIFVEWSAYWRSVVTGLLCLIGLSGGLIAWAMHVESSAAETAVKIESLEIATNEISNIASDINAIAATQTAILNRLTTRNAVPR